MNCIQCRVPYGSNEGQVCPRCQAEQDQAEHRLQELGEEYLNHEAELTTIPEGVPMNLTKDKPVLPRRIEPEDVRVGMVIEQRKGVCIMRGRVVAVEDGVFQCEVVWLRTENERNDWSLWLVEDAPAPVDPDAAAIEAIVTAYRRSPECSTHAVFGEAMLDHLRAQGFDVTARAEQ